MGGDHASGMFFFSSNCTPEMRLSQTSQRFNITLAATEKKSWDLKKFGGDKPVFHQDDQMGQAFAIYFPGLANVFVLSSTLSWDFSFFVTETAATQRGPAAPLGRQSEQAAGQHQGSVCMGSVAAGKRPGWKDGQGRGQEKRDFSSANTVPGKATTRCS